MYLNIHIFSANETLFLTEHVQQLHPFQLFTFNLIYKVVVTDLGRVGCVWSGQKLAGGWEELWTSFEWNILNTGLKEKAEAGIKQGGQQ